MQSISYIFVVSEVEYPKLQAVSIERNVPASRQASHVKRYTVPHASCDVIEAHTRVDINLLTLQSSDGPHTKWHLLS